MSIQRHWRLFEATRAVTLLALCALVAACAPSHVSSSNASEPAAGCSRECLRQALDTFVAALAARAPDRVRLAPSARLTENGRETRLGEGLWQTAGALGAYRIYVLDAATGAGAMQLVMRERDELVQVQVRLRMNASGISEAEVLVARKGDTCCWDPGRLEGLSRVYDEPVGDGERMSREEIVAAAEAYFSALHNANSPEYRHPPLAPEMNRFENGLQTTNVPNGNRLIRESAVTQLDRGMFGRIAVMNRRYPVVDVQNGSALGIVVFEYPGSTRPPEIISEFFKVSGGVIQEIRAVMVKQPATGWQE